MIRMNLLESELADRWRLNIKTLQRWRYSGRGPDFVKIGVRVIYPLPAAEAFKSQHYQSMGLCPAGERR